MPFTLASDEQAAKWARVELRSALDGFILERDAAVGDIVTSTDDLFKVADLSRFRVLAYAYEEDLPSLDALSDEQRNWTITLPSDAKFVAQRGTIEQIGHIIDPMHSGGRVGHFPSWASGRRHGPDRFLQCRVLCADEAPGGVAR